MKNLIKYPTLLIITFLLINLNVKALHLSYSEGITFEIKISVFIYNQNIKSYQYTYASLKISGDKPYSLTDSLFADINTINIKDGSQKYKIEINKPGFEPYKEVFNNQNIKAFITKPLIIVLNKKRLNNKLEATNDKAVKKDSTISKSDRKIKIFENDIVAWYPFDGNANDSSKNHYNGQDYGPSGYIEGKYSEARYFSNNQNSEAAVTDFTILPNVIGTEEFTINFWAKFDYSATHQSIFYLSPGQDWVSANFFLCLSADMKLSAIINGLDLRTIDYSHNQLLNGQFHNSYLYSSPLELNRFYNISCVFKNAVFTIYIDGKVYARYTNVYKSVEKPDAMLLIGACPKPGMLYYPYSGQLDELIFFKKALTESEINLLSKE